MEKGIIFWWCYLKDWCLVMSMDEGIIRYVSKKLDCDKRMQNKLPKWCLWMMWFFGDVTGLRSIGDVIGCNTIFHFGDLIGVEQVWQSSINLRSNKVTVFGQISHVVKIPGQRTQQSVSEFAQQTALQYSNILVSSHAAHDCQMWLKLYKQSGNTDTDFNPLELKGDIVIEMSGKYDFKVTYGLIEAMASASNVIVNWSYNIQILKESSDKYNLNKDYVKVLHKRLCSSIGTIVTGFMKATITSTSGERTQFYARPCFQGLEWYDWALVHFSRSYQPTRTDWKSLPLKNTLILFYCRKTWNCDTVFHKTTSLEYSGKNFFC